MLKLLNKRRQKGQSTLEYAILIIIIIGALLSIQVYIKRGIQGRLKQATDDIGYQYKAGGTFVNKVVTTNSYTHETFTRGVTKSTLLEDEVTQEDVNMFIRDPQEDFWGKKKP